MYQREQKSHQYLFSHVNVFVLRCIHLTRLLTPNHQLRSAHDVIRRNLHLFCHLAHLASANL